MKKLVEHYKAILNELMGLEDLVDKHGPETAKDIASHQVSRIQNYMKSRKPDTLKGSNLERVTALLGTRAGNVSHGFDQMQVSTDDRGTPVANIYDSNTHKTAFNTRTPQSTSFKGAAIWMPGKNPTADVNRRDSMQDVDRLRTAINKYRIIPRSGGADVVF
jgi:hypothetical protein